MRRIKPVKLVGLFLAASLLKGASGVYIYVIPFENIQGEEAISWLSDGLMKMVNIELGKSDDIFLKDQSELEEVMANRTLLLQQRKGTKNLLLLGKYERNLNKLSVSAQLIDISTWDELDKRKVSGVYDDIKSLNLIVTEMVQTMVRPYLPKRKPSPYPALIKGKGIRKEPEYGSKVETMGKSIETALDQLEEKMDLTIGARGEVDPSIPVEIDGEWVLDISMDPYKKDNPENQQNTSMMVDVLRTLMDNPYSVLLSKPKFEYNPDNRKEFNITLPVTYSLKGHIIRDMLGSLPYSGLKQDGTLTIFSFNRDKYNFPDQITEKIRFGHHRMVPVIQFLDSEGSAIAVLVDSPELTVHSINGKNVVYKPFHSFSPLIDFTIGGWSMQVALETVDIPVKYSFNLGLEHARNIHRVSLKFIPEKSLEAFLSNIL